MLATARMLHGAREEGMTAGGTGWEVSSTGGCSAEGWGLSAAERRGSVSPMGTSAHGARSWLALKTRLQT